MPTETSLLLQDRPHRRYNPLTGAWVFVSPHRTKRPWQGRVEAAPSIDLPRHDANCYLCPGSLRASGERNPRYESTYVFTNDFPAFLPDNGSLDVSRNALLQARQQAGTCRVICFSPRHDLTLAQMTVPEVRTVVDTWAMQTTELAARWQWVQVFENKGELMGCSNPHPHGQIWAGDFLPQEPTQELLMQQRWLDENRSVLLQDYGRLESSEAERVILSNDYWIVVVPWWAVWPFETLLLPRRHVCQLPDLTSAERDALAHALKQLLLAYDGLFSASFPYSMGWHGAPTAMYRSSQIHDAWQLHAHIYPPLLRSHSVRKFMVGYEMLAEAQRDITPEQAAEHLRQSLASVGES
jgi:UDPglucose--hexose-1-phosphate uridylyltransferase